MNIFGYSERGAINSLLFEIAFSGNSAALMQRLLGRAIFLQCEPPTGEIAAATALIEQSLSDFGDADAVLLLDRPLSKSAVFVEGKVKSSQSKDWTLVAQFAAFRDGLTSKVSSSNLFTQLYHKARFVHATQGEGQQMLRDGLRFPTCSSKAVRRIGANPVVLRAVDKITPYAADSYYLAIVPDSEANVRAFVAGTLAPFAHDALEMWDATRWGFLCWADVHEFCTAEGLKTTSAVLEFNKGQIC